MNGWLVDGSSQPDPFCIGFQGGIGASDLFVNNILPLRLYLPSPFRPFPFSRDPNPASFAPLVHWYSSSTD